MDNVVGILLWLVFLVLSAIQIAAFMTGLEVWLGWGTVASLVAGVALLAIIPFGAVLAIGVSFYGAWRGWRLDWWQALLLTCPFLILQFVLLGAGGVVAIFNSARSGMQRDRSL